MYLVTLTLTHDRDTGQWPWTRCYDVVHVRTGLGSDQDRQTHTDRRSWKHKHDALAVVA